MRDAVSAASTRITAVVITFEPGEGLQERLQALVNQVAAITVIDNSVEPSTQHRIAETGRSLGCTVVTNGRNAGVAEALNQGVRAAHAAGASFVLTMDQDSVAEPAMVEELLRVLEAAAREGIRVGILAPTPVDATTGLQTSVRVTAAPWSEATMAITSGSLIPMAVFQDVGLFRADYFIDSIDQEFCLRVRQHGYRILHAHRAGLRHQLGQPVIHRVFGRRFIPTNHSATRRYYMARNVIWTTKLFLRSDRTAVLVLTLKLLKNALLVALLEEHRGPKLRAIAAGLVRGLTTRPADIPVLA